LGARRRNDESIRISWFQATVEEVKTAGIFEEMKWLGDQDDFRTFLIERPDSEFFEFLPV